MIVECIVTLQWLICRLIIFGKMSGDCQRSTMLTTKIVQKHNFQHCQKPSAKVNTTKFAFLSITMNNCNTQNTQNSLQTVNFLLLSYDIRIILRVNTCVLSFPKVITKISKGKKTKYMILVQERKKEQS